MKRTIEDDIARLCRKAREWGASHAAAIAVNDIAVDERTWLKCLVPLCSHYNRDLLCPPHVIPVAQFREVLGRYHEAIVIGLEIPADDLLSPRTDYLNVARNSQKKLHEIVSRVESLCLEQGHCFAAGLIGGACPLCDECVGIDSGLPCRHPFKARASMEAMGIDVMSTARKAGLDLDFRRDGGRSWVGLVLVD